MARGCRKISAIETSHTLLRDGGATTSTQAPHTRIHCSLSKGHFDSLIHFSQPTSYQDQYHTSTKNASSYTRTISSGCMARGGLPLGRLDACDVLWSHPYTTHQPCVVVIIRRVPQGSTIPTSPVVIVDNHTTTTTTATTTRRRSQRMGPTTTSRNGATNQARLETPDLACHTRAQS